MQKLETMQAENESFKNEIREIKSAINAIPQWIWETPKGKARAANWK